MNLEYQLQHGMKSFELPDGPYSVSDIQNYFKCNFKNMRQLLIMFQ